MHQISGDHQIHGGLPDEIAGLAIDDAKANGSLVGIEVLGEYMPLPTLDRQETTAIFRLETKLDDQSGRSLTLFQKRMFDHQLLQTSGQIQSLLFSQPGPQYPGRSFRIENGQCRPTVTRDHASRTFIEGRTNDHRTQIA